MQQCKCNVWTVPKSQKKSQKTAQELTEEKPYVTVDSGKDLIISLTKSLKGVQFE